jgi:hypothetical protein
MAARAAMDLEDLLDELGAAADAAGDEITAREIYDAVEGRTFGPLLLTAGLLGLTPVSAVPTAPTTLATVVALTAGQLLAGRKTLWLPQRLLGLSVGTDKLRTALKLARRPARFVDRLLRPHLQFLISGVGARVVALACMVVAFLTPPLEFLPFATFLPASAITAFGLGLVARDGLLALLALGGTAAVVTSAGFALLG